jgi:hypothetical protein
MNRRQLIKAAGATVAANVGGRVSSQTGSNRAHLFGDSIFRGWALRSFPDRLSPLNPLFAFSSIALTANVLTTASDIPVSFHYAGYAFGRPSADIVIPALIEQEEIRPGDFVLFEDAGPHLQDPDLYQARWEDMRRAVPADRNLTVIMMTMCDYPPAPPECQYDRVFGSRSMNDATRTAAAAELPHSPRAHLLDLNARMDAFRESLLTSDDIDPIHPDGIHPNVWGQLFIVGEILRATGVGSHINSFEPIRDIASRNWHTLGYGTRSPTWTAIRSADLAEYCLRG